MGLWPASKVKTFIEQFVRIDNKPAKLLNWQWERLIKPLYQVPRTKRKVQLWLPKKSGKSAICSMLLLVGLLEKPGSNVVVLASTVQQAGIIFNGAAKIIESNKSLRSNFWVRKHVNRIEAKNGSVCHILSGTPRGKAGYNLDYLIVDELGEFSASYARQIYDQLAFSTMARPDAIQFYLSTAQFEREGHIAWELYQEATAVQADPSKDPQQLAIVYSVPETVDWKNPDNWWAYLPSCPEIVPREFYLSEFAKLKQDTLGEARFRTLLLNQYNGAMADSWISGFTWQNCKATGTEADLYGCKAWAGLDMSRRFDLTCWLLLVEKDNRLFLLPRFFICEDGATRKSKEDGFPYTLHAKNPNHHICLTPGDVIDPAYIRKQIVEDCNNFRVQNIGYDGAYLSDETRQILSAEHAIEMIEVKQNYKVLSSPTVQFERWVRTKRIAHLDNPLLNWCVENTRLRTDGGAVMIDKKAARARVDGVSAAITAVQRYLDRAVGKNPLIVL